MKTISTIAACALLAAAGTANADEITQSHDFTLNGTVNTNDSFQMDSFDNQGGTRLLTDIRVNIDGVFDIGIYAENLEDRSISSTEWYFEPFVATTLEIAGLHTGGIWSVGFGQVSASLAARDGIDGSGNDYASWSADGVIFNELFMNDPFFPAFETNGTGTIDGTLSVFTDLLLTPPPPMFNAGFTRQRQSGTFSLTYVYTTVPTPSSVSLLALSGLALSRRRRTR